MCALRDIRIDKIEGFLSLTMLWGMVRETIGWLFEIINVLPKQFTRPSQSPAFLNFSLAHSPITFSLSDPEELKRFLKGPGEDAAPTHC